MSDRKAVIKNADMGEEMQQDAVDCATQALEKYNIEKVIKAPPQTSSFSFAINHRRTTIQPHIQLIQQTQKGKSGENQYTIAFMHARQSQSKSISSFWNCGGRISSVCDTEWHRFSASQMTTC